MNRKELYAKIKEYNLQETVKSIYKENYTRVKSEDLALIVAKAEKQQTNAHSTTKEVTKEAGDTTDLASRFTRLIKVLEKKHILLASEVIYINN